MVEWMLPKHQIRVRFSYSALYSPPWVDEYNKESRGARRGEAKPGTMFREYAEP